MIVDPDFPDHWKTRMLVDMLDGDEAAPVYLLRLWAHCQNRRKSTFENLPSAALKALCRYPGHPDKLEASLATSGFIFRDEEGGLHVCGWAEYNASLVASWENGKKGGRPKKVAKSRDSTPTKEPTGNPRETHGKPMENPWRTDKRRVDKRREDKIPHTTTQQPPAAEAASLEMEIFPAKKDDSCVPEYTTRRKRKITGQRLEDFERFWKVWSQGWIGKRDTGKAATADAWLDIPSYCPELVERIIAAAQKESDERPALIASGKTPKWSQGWINERRWEVEEPADDVPYREIVEAYHKALDGLPRCKTATDERKARLATLFRFFKGNLQSIESYFRLVDRNPRLRRESWVNLDWLADPTNCARIMDGNYDT